MGWARGENNNHREIGYAVEGPCDYRGCETVIDYGIDAVCGALDGAQNAGMDDEAYCGGLFCGEHMGYLPALDDGEFRGHLQACMVCIGRQACPACGNRGHDDDGEPCEVCDSHGVHAQREGVLV